MKKKKTMVGTSEASDNKERTNIVSIQKRNGVSIIYMKSMRCGCGVGIGILALV